MVTTTSFDDSDRHFFESHKSYEQLLKEGAQNLKRETAEILIQVGEARLVFLYPGSFKLNPNDWQEIIQNMIETEDRQVLISLLDKILPSMLEPFEEKYHFLQFQKDIGIPSELIYQRYANLFRSGDTKRLKEFIDRIKSFDDEFIYSERYDEEFLSDDFFKEIIRYRFPDESNCRFEDSDNCPDRSTDVSKYDGDTRKATLILNPNVTWEVKEGQVLDSGAVALFESAFRRAQIMYSHVTPNRRLQLFCKVYGSGDPTDRSEPQDIVYNARKQLRSGRMVLERFAEIVTGYHFAVKPDIKLFVRDCPAKFTVPAPTYPNLMFYREFYASILPETLRALDSSSDVGGLESNLMPLVEGIDRELAKFEARRGASSVMTLTSYVAKNRAAAHALRTAGVLQANDIPERGLIADECLWNKDNFSVDILQDEMTRECLGANLLHELNEDGNLFLLVSLNPSASLLYKVDEEQLFRRLLDRLIKFAEDNLFDYLIMPKDPELRTSRRGGKFESAIDNCTLARGESYTFQKPAFYSYLPLAAVREFHVLWKRES